MKKELVWLHTHICYWNGGTKFILRTATELTKHYNVTLFVEDSDPEIKKEFERRI